MPGSIFTAATSPVNDSRLPGQVADQPRHCFFAAPGAGWCLVWHDRQSEEILARLWNASPSCAYALHAGLLEGVMSFLGRLIPEIRAHGCAPLPPPCPELDHHLGRLGLHRGSAGQLDRAYAVLTHFPWQGGCVSCALGRTCPARHPSPCPASRIS